MEVFLEEPRAHFAMLETDITHDLLVMGGITGRIEGVTSSVERIYRNADWGLCSSCGSTATACPSERNPCMAGPVVASDNSSLNRPRAFAPAVVLSTHNPMVVSGWDGTDNEEPCSPETPATGCTSEIVSLGDLSYLGMLF
jgi:hypothetical protein